MKMRNIFPITFSAILLSSAAAFADTPAPQPPEQSVPTIVDQLYATMNGLDSTIQDATVNNANNVTLTRNARTQLNTLLRQLSTITKTQHDTIDNQQKELKKRDDQISKDKNEMKNLQDHINNQAAQIVHLQQQFKLPPAVKQFPQSIPNKNPPHVRPPNTPRP